MNNASGLSRYRVPLRKSRATTGKVKNILSSGDCPDRRKFHFFEDLLCYWRNAKNNSINIEKVPFFNSTDCEIVHESTRKYP